MASSSSKLLTLSSLFLRSLHPHSSTPRLLLTSSSRRLFNSYSKPFPSLHFSTTTAALADAVVESSAVRTHRQHHPWPEWEVFLEKLRSKGYFELVGPTAAPPGEVGGVLAGDVHATADQNRVKNACLKFARERFDILGSLPKQDIQAVVECGCPNLFRKAVNSAKRLRAFLQLDEADVCSACKLRGSCDKAYVITKDEEGARTVDVVRLLLSYAIDPASNSGEHVSGNVQESARKLLSELIRLSDTSVDPSLPKPVFNVRSQKEPSQKVFAKPIQSLGKGRETTAVEMKKGDWLCPNCNFLNFARNLHCLECKADGPKKVESVEMKLGDWTCPKCNFMNFARNKECFRCLESTRPKRNLNPGEWECPSCDYVNFRRNLVCLKCNCNRPEVAENQYENNIRTKPKESATRDQFEDHVWRKPKESVKSSTFDFRDEDEEKEDEGEDDDILPFEGERRFIINKRATPSMRNRTASRNQ